MFDPVQEMVSSFIGRLVSDFDSQFPEHAQHSACLRLCAETACAILVVSDAAYHNIDHSIRVTMVGQEILRGKQVFKGPISADDWLNFTVSLLMHDVGYIRGVCGGDDHKNANYIMNTGGQMARAPEGSTDAFLAPYHVTRGQIAVRERFAGQPLLDVDSICINIERTRFPVPDNAESKITDDYAGLVRAADLIGQLSDPLYPQKHAALFYEFQETGAAEKMGYTTPADIGKHYPKFYWGSVSEYLEHGLAFLRRTQDGQAVVAGLFAHVFSEEHSELVYGPSRQPLHSVG